MLPLLETGWKMVDSDQRVQVRDKERLVVNLLATQIEANGIGGPAVAAAGRAGAGGTFPVNTVKTHLRHLYAKLGVHRRREAVDRARDLGLFARHSPARESAYFP